MRLRASYAYIKDEPCASESRDQASNQCDSANSDYAVHYKPPERRDEQVYRHNAGRELDGNANVHWQDELKVPNKYVAYRHKFLETLAQFEVCGMPASDRVWRYSTESSSNNQKAALYIQLHTGLVLNQKNSRNKRAIGCSLWPLLSPPRPNGCHTSCSCLRRMAHFASASNTENLKIIRSDNGGLVPDTTDGEMYRLAGRF